MTYFAVVRDAGPAWTDGKGAFEQPGVNDHAAFMNGLADEGVVLFAGPLAGSEQGRIRALVIVNADDEAAVHNRLAADPWSKAEMLVTTSVEPWTLFVGADRIGHDQLGGPLFDNPRRGGRRLGSSPGPGVPETLRSMKFNARRASLAFARRHGDRPRGRADVGAAPAAAPRRHRGDRPRRPRSRHRDRLVEAGVKAVVNAAPMISGRYANLGPEVLAEAGILVVDQVGSAGVDRIPDDQVIRVHDGVVYAVAPDGDTPRSLRRGAASTWSRCAPRWSWLARGWSSSSTPLPTPPVTSCGANRSCCSTAAACPSWPRSSSGVRSWWSAPPTTPTCGDRPVPRASGTPVLIARRRRRPTCSCARGLTPDVVRSSPRAMQQRAVRRTCALGVAADVVFVAPSFPGLVEQATIEAVAGPPWLVDLSATARGRRAPARRPLRRGPMVQSAFGSARFDRFSTASRPDGPAASRPVSSWVDRLA